MSLTPQKLTPFSVSLLTSPALVLRKGKNAEEVLAYEGELRNKIDLSHCSLPGEPPLPVFSMDYSYRFVVDKETKVPQAFFLRGGAEKFKLTFKEDGAPKTIFYSTGTEDATLKDRTKFVVRGKVHQKTSEIYGQYQYCKPLQIAVFDPRDNTKHWIDTKLVQDQLSDDKAKDNFGTRLMGISGSVDIALQGAKLCLEEIKES